MDETDAPLNRSTDEAEISKSSDENSFIGKMKVGVSRILPKSFSKWLSPKVDVTNARRRRHEEMDSDEDGAVRVDGSPAATLSDIRYQTTPQLAAPPPNKKKKTFTDFLNRNTHDSYSPSVTPSIGERSNIVSSTLIEDVPLRTNNQFNRYSPLENGQHAADSADSAASPANAENSTRDNALNYRSSNDEALSAQSREKPTNPFTINNDSSVVNFSAHLQRAKSLFSHRSYVSPRLKNYRMRNPRSSLYRSTSSLCDNNSVSSNASSAMSSPFYNGQTTFGGASATSRRMSTTMTTLNQDIQMHHHRPKVPTNLVTSRSTSSLNTIGGASSASMSTTAKRILDVMSKYNTPLTEVRRISNALPSIAETSALNKRKSILELEMNTNEIDKTKRTLLKPNTPYNRPFGRHPVDSVLTNELHVPSMPELLQLKKFATNTVNFRNIANKSDNILNRPVSTVATESELKAKIAATKDRVADADLDASNNNKFVNNKNNVISTNSANDVNREHRNKIRSNLNKRRVGKCTDADAMPEAVNLPNIPLMMDEKVEIKFSEPLKFPNAVNRKTGDTPDNGLQIPFKSKSSNTNAITAPSTKENKPTNGNTCETSKKSEVSPAKPTLSTQPATSWNNARVCTDVSGKPQSVVINYVLPSTYRFTEPIIVKTSKSSKSFEQQNHFGNNKSIYKFSEPTYVTDKPNISPKSSETAANTISNFKFDPKPMKRVSSDSGIADTTQSFGSNASKTTVKPTFTASTASEFSTAGQSISPISAQHKDDDTFKSFVAKQKQGKWECKDCFASNKSMVNKCVCCGAAKKEGDTSVKNSQSQSAAVIVDDTFKSLAAKQKQSKWECKDCMTQNDQAQSKCLCCGGSNPNGSAKSVTDKEPIPLKPTFSFGTLPSSSASLPTAAIPPITQPIDSKFRLIVDKQKSTWECSACLSANDVSKSKCACCEQSRDVTKGATTNATMPAKSQLSFGSNLATASAPSRSGFSFGSNTDTVVSAASTFSFGNLAGPKTDSSAQLSFGSLKGNDSTSTTSNGKTETDKAKDSIEKPPASSSAQFSFGNSTVLPSTSKIVTIPKADAPASTDSFFKSIVDRQKSSSWECSSCMTKNSIDIKKCVCCETPKDGSISEDGAKKEFCLTSSQKSVFGTPSGSSSTFSFGSKPENKSSFQFGTSSSNSSSTLSTSKTTSTATVSTTSNIFGSSSQAPTLSFTASKPATTTVSTASSQSAVLSGFKFSFGSPPSTTAPTFGAKVASKDEIDTGAASNTNDSNRSISDMENVLVKPVTNGPIESAQTSSIFKFGQNLSKQTTDEPITKAQKRPNAELSDNNILTNFTATSTVSNRTPFIFGQPQNTNNNAFSTASNPTTNIPKESSAAQTTNKNPTFPFGTSKPSTNAFPTMQPSFSSTSSFLFNPSNTIATTTAAAVTSPFGGAAATATTVAGNLAQPIFGGNAFSSALPQSASVQPVFGSNVFPQPSSTLPALGGFKADTTFGSSTFASGTLLPNTTAQPKATSSPAAPGLFPFGTTTNNQNVPLSGEQPNIGGFNFSLNTPPTFNFSEQSTQQANVPFQFGAPSDTSNIFSAQPSANVTATQQRRKLRPIRRVNRP